MSDQVQGRTVRLQYLKKGGLTPEYIDLPIPTEPLRLKWGPGRGTSTKGVGSAWLMGTKYLPGSPYELSYQVTKLRLSVSTPNVWFAVVHSRLGTVDTPYEAIRGDDLTVTDLQTPVYSFQPGTLRMYALGPGSSLSTGKGTTTRFQGVGSGGPFNLSAALDLYPV
jgi:hypothetical protein